MSILPVSNTQSNLHAALAPIPYDHAWWSEINRRLAESPDWEAAVELECDVAHSPQQTPEQKAKEELIEIVEDTVRRILINELPAAVEYLLEKEGNSNAA